MKNLLYILVAILILAACDDSDPTNPTPEPELCPAPVKIPGIGYHRPPAHQLQTVSYDYNYLAFKNEKNLLKVLDLQTNSLREFGLNEYLPDSVKIQDIEYLDWSPYDNHRILIQVKTLTDTSEVESKEITTWNIYFFDINTKSIEYVYSMYYMFFVTWLPQSGEGKDYILMNNEIYFPQEQKFSNNDNVFFWGSEHSISDNGQYFITFIQTDGGGSFEQRYGVKNNHGNIFGEVEYFTMTYERLNKAQKISWSPDSKYVAFSGAISQWDKTPVEERSYFEIWVIDFYEMYDIAEERRFIQITAPYSIIDLRKEFCMYMFGGTGLYGQMDTEFISDTTMAVSMHEDGAEYSYLYEISIHGEMIRQLTFEP